MTATVPGLLRAAAARWPSRPALKSMTEAPTSFATLDHHADRFARALIADGMQTGEAIALWAPNMWEWVATAVGVQRAGGTLVPLNIRLRAAEVGDILRRVGAARLVAIGEHRGENYPHMLAGEALPE